MTLKTAPNQPELILGTSMMRKCQEQNGDLLTLGVQVFFYGRIPVACAEDRATLESDPSAVAGGCTDGAELVRLCPFSMS